MSSKQLRKLQAQQAQAGYDAGVEKGTDNQDVSLASEEQPAQQKPRFGFAMLDDSESDDDAEGTPAATISGPQADPVDVKSKEETVGAKSKKANKKKNKKQKAKTDVTEAREDVAEDDDDDILAAAIAEMSEQKQQADEPKESSCQGAPFVLAMSKLDFSAEREKKKLFGEAAARDSRESGKHPRGAAVRARGSHEGSFAHHRRLFLVEPASHESWPRPEGCAEMVASCGSDGTQKFDIKGTAVHKRIRMELVAAQLSHDPNVIQDFTHAHPFCVEGLLVLAEICRASGEMEQAFTFVRMAVYAVECSFGAGFSPFSQCSVGSTPHWPRVRLQLPNADDFAWAGWPWLLALRMYALGLHAQGLNRTAIEVCKLVLASTLPRDPAHLLVQLDVFCLRANQYDLLQSFAAGLLHPLLIAGAEADRDGTEPAASITSRIDCILPNFAFSVAFARHLSAAGDPDLLALKHVTVADVLTPRAWSGDTKSENEPSCSTHAMMMRALLFFPQVLRPLLKGAAVNTDAPVRLPSSSQRASDSWEQVLAQEPFSNSHRHERHFLIHALMADAYAVQCAQLWRGEATLNWVYACAVRLTQICKSSLFADELAAARKTWAQEPTVLDVALTHDYVGFSVGEVGLERTVPRTLEQAMNFDFGLQAHLARQRPAPSQEFVPEVADEEAQLQRALDLSRQAEESLRARSIIEEQDAEYRESLAADQARSASAAAPIAEDSVAQLVSMGFEAAEARTALEASGGDIEAAVLKLTSA